MRAEALQDDEDALRNELPPHRRQLIAGKRVLLLAEMCRDARVADDGVVDLQLAGAPSSGIPGSAGLFLAVEQHAPAMDDEQIVKSSRWSRKMIASRDNNCGDNELVEEVWQITMDEVSKGWLQGPMSDSQVREELGPLQSDKVRPIDDMSRSLGPELLSQRFP